MRLRLFALVAAASASTVASSMVRVARADDPAPPSSSASGADARSSPNANTVRWRPEWQKFTIPEAMISAAITVRNSDLGQHLSGPNSATIEFEVPVLDHGFRDLFRAESEHRRKGAARLSDLGFRSLVFAPYLIDVGFGALALHRNAEVAAQLALIDFEVLTLAGMTQLLLSRVIGRARPYATSCPPEGCSGGPYRSFVSGHAMASFAAAGLMCVHHEKLPLFGGGAADKWACIWALSVASMTSTLRLVADEHWASDVLIGGGLGWVYGYYLPKLLHFHTAKIASGRRGANGSSFTWAPMFTGTTERGVVGVMGSF